MRGTTFGVVFWATHLWWVVASTGLLAWIALVAWTTAGAAVTAILARSAGTGRGSAVLLAATWWGVEAGRSTWPLGGLPWGRLGVTALDTPWTGLLSFVGVGGTSLLIAWAGVVVARLATTGVRRAVWPHRRSVAPRGTAAGRPVSALGLAALLLAASVTGPGTAVGLSLIHI